MISKLTILLLLFLPWSIFCQNPVVKMWDQRYGGTNSEYLYQLIQTEDRGYMLVGASNSPISGNKSQIDWDSTNQSADAWMVKMDSDGNFQWDRRFGGTLNDQPWYGFIQTRDGGYMVAPQCYSDSNGDKTQHNWGNPNSDDYWIVKMDSHGNKQWDKRFGGTSDEDVAAVVQTKDNGYLVGGTSFSALGRDVTSAPYGNGDYWIVKIDSAGNKQWDKRYGSTGIDILHSMQATSDGGFILAGHSTSNIGNDKSQNCFGAGDFWMVKIDSAGNKLWDQTYGGSGREVLNSAQLSADGGYVLAGY